MTKAIYNPQGKSVKELPIIYGFNNGGEPGWYTGQLLAEDGTALGSHLCSNDFYMLADLGIVAGSRPDRHETFRKHYPEGYRMDFVPAEKVGSHKGLRRAYAKNQELKVKFEKDLA